LCPSKPRTLLSFHETVYVAFLLKKSNQKKNSTNAKHAIGSADMSDKEQFLVNFCVRQGVFSQQ